MPRPRSVEIDVAATRQRTGLLGEYVAGHLLRASGRRYVEVPHVGNKGLNGKYTVPVQLASASGAVRREYRVRRWADAVVQAITSEPGV